MMRLPALLAMAYVLLALQVGLGAHLRIGSAVPNLVLTAVVFAAVFSARDLALIGCILIGFAQDLLTQQGVGIYALSYGTLALLAVNTQAMLHREHPAAHLLLSGAGAMITTIVILFHGWWRGGGESFGAVIGSAALTVIACLALMQLLLRLRPALGIRSSRRW